MVEVGDLLLAMYGATSGDIAVSKIKGAINQAILCIRTKQNKKFIESVWNKHVSKNLRKYLQGGQGNLSADIVKGISFFFPTLKEQEKIANLVSLLDERIATLNKIIEDLKKLKCAIAERLFKVTNGEVVALSEVCNIQKGKQVNGDCLSETGTYYVMNGGTEPSGYYEQCNAPADTISISEGGNSCGYIQYNRDAFWSGGHCYTLTDIQSNVCNLYLYHYLKSKESTIMKLRIGTGLPNIQKKDLEKFAVLLPPVAKQVRISTFLTAIERKTTNEEILLSHFQEEKQYLLRQMFI